MLQGITIDCLIFRMAADLELRSRRGRSNSVSSVHSRLGNRNGSIQNQRRLRRTNININLRKSTSERNLGRSVSQNRLIRARSRSNTRRAPSQASRPRSVSRVRLNTGNQRRRVPNRSAIRGNRAPSRGAIQNRVGNKKTVNPITARRNNQRANRVLKNNVRNRREILLQNGVKRQVRKFKHGFFQDIVKILL